MDDHTPPPPLVDFDRLRGRVGNLLIPVAGLCLLGAVVDGVIEGLTFALLGRWFGIFLLGCILAAAVATALHALGGADRASRRGERLASPDVGIAPRRYAREDPTDPDREEAPGRTEGGHGDADGPR